MPLWTLVIWLLIGLIAGYLASRIMGGAGRYGLIGDIVVGLIGSVIGGWIVGLLGLSGGGGIIGSIIVSVLGAMLFIYLLRMFTRANV